MSDNDSSSTASSPVKRRKKGERNTQQYKQIAIREAKVHGKEHLNHKNKPMEPRKTGDTCKCFRKCFSTIPEESLKLMIEKMNAFTTKDEQDVFLQGLIDVHQPKNCKKRMSEADLQTKSKSKTHRFKSNTFEYHIELYGRQTVCRVAFQSFFGITKKRVERLCFLKSNNESPQDMRGKSAGCRSRMIAGEDCHKIQHFIEIIPVEQVHYSNITRTYLSAALNVKIMYEMFLKKHPECETSVKYKFFLKYFNENFNLAFGRPQVEMNIKDNHQKTDSLRSVCKESEIGVLCLDQMQNPPLPRLPEMEISLYRQAWVNQFCIPNLKTERATYYPTRKGRS